jgi:glycosyl transferase family 25
LLVFAAVFISLVVAVAYFNIEDVFDLFRENQQLDFAFRNCNSGKIKAYILNLDRATERLQYVLPQVSSLDIPFRRIPAIDGNTPPKDKINELTDINSYINYFRTLPEPGTIGCTLSHEIAWRLFLKSDDEFAIIFEDDVKFDPQQLRQTVESVIKKKHLWDIVGFELNHSGCPMKMAELSRRKFLATYFTNVKHAGAYIINRTAAHRLLQKLYPIKMPVDHYFTRSWEFGLKFCGVEPRIVEQKFGDSQIKSHFCQKISSPKILFNNLIFNLYTSAMYSMYNFYFYIFSGFYR